MKTEGVKKKEMDELFFIPPTLCVRAVLTASAVSLRTLERPLGFPRRAWERYEDKMNEQ